MKTEKIDNRHDQEVFLTLDLIMTSSIYCVLERLIAAEIPQKLPDHPFFKLNGFMSLFTEENHKSCSGDFMNSLELIRFTEEENDSNRLQVRLTIRSVIKDRIILFQFLSWLINDLIEYRQTRYIGYIRDCADPWPTLIHQMSWEDTYHDIRPRINFTPFTNKSRNLRYELFELLKSRNSPRRIEESPSQLLVPGNFTTVRRFDIPDSKNRIFKAPKFKEGKNQEN